MTAGRELPVVDETACTGCGDCAAVCPTGCLEVARVAWLPRPADCLACAACVWVCPAGAIAMSEWDARPPLP